MHTSILENIVESTRESLTRIIGNSTYYYTVSPKMESENLEKIVSNYIDYFNDNFKVIQIVIVIIIITVLTILVTTLLCCKNICCCKIKNI